MEALHSPALSVPKDCIGPSVKRCPPLSALACRRENLETLYFSWKIIQKMTETNWPSESNVNSIFKLTISSVDPTFFLLPADFFLVLSILRGGRGNPGMQENGLRDVVTSVGTGTQGRAMNPCTQEKGSSAGAWTGMRGKSTIASDSVAITRSLFWRLRLFGPQYYLITLCVAERVIHNLR
jgi:hypothetical protein